MSTAPEARFKTKIKKAVGCYCLATSERFSRGVPDHWYSGPAGSLFVEYKFDDKSKRILPKLTDHQRRWLNDRYAEGRNVAVIVATSFCKGIIYVDGEWNSTYKEVNTSQPFSDLVAFIERITIGDAKHDGSSDKGIRSTRTTCAAPRSADKDEGSARGRT